MERSSKREPDGNYKEFLELLGIWDKIEIIDTPHFYKSVIIPERGFERNNYYSKQFKDVYLQIACNAILRNNDAINSRTYCNSKKIFMSRSKLQKAAKREIYLDSLDEFFKRNNYNVVYPEKTSLTELICLIYNAETVAMVSGSLQHNILFASDNKNIEIFERFPINIDNQIYINKIKNARAVYVDACYPIYPTNLSGPLIMGYTDCFRKWASRKNYTLCRSHREFRRVFSQYIKAYRSDYGICWYSSEWYFEHYRALYEGYKESEVLFGEYMRNEKLYAFRQLLEFPFYKNLLRRIVKKLIEKH